MFDQRSKDCSCGHHLLVSRSGCYGRRGGGEEGTTLQDDPHSNSSYLLTRHMARATRNASGVTRALTHEAGRAQQSANWVYKWNTGLEMMFDSMLQKD